MSPIHGYSKNLKRTSTWIFLDNIYYIIDNYIIETVLSLFYLTPGS